MNELDRVGEEGYNNFGSKMIIVEYRGALDIDVYSPEYDWTFKNAQYSNFKKGNVLCPYEKRYFGVGYLGEGKYKAYENGKQTRVYQTWHNMLERCYSEKYHEKHTTYMECEACKEWLNFQEYGKWFEGNYYEIEGERMCLDKDILVKHNKIYSPNNCIFVPHKINLLFTKSDKIRGEYPIGVCYHKRDKVYEANCHLINPKTGKSKNEYLGRYDTELEAFEVYKYYKEKNIKQVADYYKKLIPQKLYNALYSYEVEITD